MAYPEIIHRKSYDDKWVAHHLIFSCFRQQPFFSGERAPGWFLEFLAKGRSAKLFDLWGFVIMPEHVHLLILPAEGVLIRNILTKVKRPFSGQVVDWVSKNSPDFLEKMIDEQPNGKKTYRFWQRGGGYDRNLRGTRDIHEKLHYIQDNPVRRKLVERPEDWPWSSARAWATGKDDPIAIDRASFPVLVK
jgi:putative transposase